VVLVEDIWLPEETFPGLLDLKSSELPRGNADSWFQGSWDTNR
jgi:hypothetical protein